jgi:hypothetical protein
VISAAAVPVALGCSGPVTPGAFTDTTGEAKPTQVAYPAEPFGVGVGSVIPNFQFIGYANAMGTQASTQTIRLSDFFNPHAFDKSYQPASPADDDRLFPADSGYAMAGKPKPTVMLIDIASVWCVPCNDEARTLLPFKHALYGPCGAEFFLDLHDSNTPGITASLQNLKNWTKFYKVDFPAATDPEYRLDPFTSGDFYPSNLIVDTTTMKIVHVVAGEVVPGQCNYTDSGQTCTQASDCLSQTCVAQQQGGATYCADALCGTSSDLAVCNDTSQNLNCGGLSACNNSTACAQYDFWTIFESHLDKSRPGCALQ